MGNMFYVTNVSVFFSGYF